MKHTSKNIRRFLSTGFCFALITGLVACGGGEQEVTEEVGTIETTDEDAGVMENWDTERFNTDFAANNRYGEWDANDDEFLDENEYYTGFFDTWDVNDDNIVDENEWNTANNDFGLRDQNWADWDVNNDKQLDDNEFRTGFAQLNYYRDWDQDRDNRISSREYSDGIFSLWDENEDGALDNNEYNERYNRYYGM